MTPDLQQLKLQTSGIEFGYTDSGAPNKQQYTTIVAIHGMCFSAHVFQRAQTVALHKGTRFVALNRRNYPGTSPFTAAEIDVLNNGDDTRKAKWLEARGHEISEFIVQFAKEKQLPSLSADGREGGIVILGWSVGIGEANATIACADSLPSSIRTHFTSQVKALILNEGGPIMMGLPMPEKNYSPFVVEAIPPELRLPAFGQWVTGYFDHGDLSSRDLNNLSYVLPSTDRLASLWNMSKAEQRDLLFNGQESQYEGLIMFSLQSQLNAVYRKALFDPSVRKLFPALKISFFAGTTTVSFGIAGLWTVEKDAKEAGQKDIILKMVPGANHFIHWDEPELAVDTYLFLS